MSSLYDSEGVGSPADAAYQHHIHQEPHLDRMSSSHHHHQGGSKASGGNQGLQMSEGTQSAAGHNKHGSGGRAPMPLPPASSGSSPLTTAATGIGHRISIHVKVEENSASSTEESGASTASNECNTTVSSAGSALQPLATVASASTPNGGLSWSGSCLYRCNLGDGAAPGGSTSGGRGRCLYGNCQAERCQDESHVVKRTQAAEAEPLNGNLQTVLRDRFVCSSTIPPFAPALGSGQNGSYHNLAVSNSLLCSLQDAKADSGHNLLSDESHRQVSSNRGGGCHASDLGSSGGNEAAMDEKRQRKIPPDPMHWDTDHVRMWLEWTIREYSLHDIDVSTFNRFLGKDLARLSREDFSSLTNPYNGEILFAHLQFFRQSAVSTVQPSNVHREKSASGLTSEDKAGQQHQTSSQVLGFVSDHLSSSWGSSLRGSSKSESSYKGAWSSPTTSPSQGYHHNAITGMSKSSALDSHTHPHLRNMQDPYQLFGPTSNRLASSGSGQIQLWQFLLELLSDSGNSNCITWEGTNGEFKLTDPDEVARRWGERKSKPNMNYDKLSRALRYYYDKNIMTKVHGKRYAYKFDFQGLAQATQPAAADPAAYKAAYQSADLFMHPPGYPHPSSAAKLNFAAAVHSAGMPSSGAGSIFPSPSSYWTSPNLYSNIAAASAGHHSSVSHHHPSHVTSHIGSYPHYA